MKSGSYDERKTAGRQQSNVSFPDTGLETRIGALAELYNSRKEAAQAAGIGLSTLQRWITGEAMPAFHSLAQLAAGRGVSLDWLASGRGDMRLVGAQAIDEDTYALIPLYDARISQGHGAWIDGARVLTQLAFTRYSLRRKGLEPDQLAAVRVDGDSNEPVLSDGDTVMMDLSRNALQGEAFYVIRLDDLIYAKRLQRQFDGSIVIISANSAYKEMVVPHDRLDSLQIIGRVVWAGGWMI
nr:helix-turn-helix transcriptional regulator [uncultured Pseudomonas sp.]